MAVRSEARRQLITDKQRGSWKEDKLSCTGGCEEGGPEDKTVSSLQAPHRTMALTIISRSTKESWNVLSVEEDFLFLLGLSSRQRLQLLILKLDLGDANWLLRVSLLRGYPWLTKLLHREVVIEGQDKVFKDVIEPLESVSVNMILPSNKIFETLVLHNRLLKRWSKKF